jgi:alcohol dehydrogenase class IV
MEALPHAVEAYMSTRTIPITDACVLQAIQLISAYSEYLAGMAFNNAGI